MVETNRVVFVGSTGFGPTGLRPSVQKMLEAIDREDPALLFITEELKEALAGGAKPTEELIHQAVEVGRARYAEEVRLASIPPSIVYYIRRGGLIKIGTTTKPRKRFIDLLPDEIMAWEPGGRAEEAGRHRQFAHLRVRDGVEYFHAAGDLVDHVQTIRGTHGSPHPAWPTIENIQERVKTRVKPDQAKSAELVTISVGTARLGIRYNTAVVWVHRGKLKAVAEDDEGKPLYLLDHMASLSRRGSRKS